MEQKCPLSLFERRIDEIRHYSNIAIDNKLLKQFGTTVDISISLWDNVKVTFGNMSKTTYFNRRNNMTFHNLCVSSSPPPTSNTLLGLGLKFCLQTRRPLTSKINEGIIRMTRDIRLKYHLADCDDEDNDPDNEYNNKIVLQI